jgi:hypothetical protein
MVFNMTKEDVSDQIKIALALESIALEDAINLIAYVHQNPLEPKEINDYNQFVYVAFNVAEGKKNELLEKHPKKTNNPKYEEQKKKWDKNFKILSAITKAIYKAVDIAPLNLNL